MNSPHKWPVTRKMLQFDDVITLSINKVLLKCVNKSAYKYHRTIKRVNCSDKLYTWPRFLVTKQSNEHAVLFIHALLLVRNKENIKAWRCQLSTQKLTLYNFFIRTSITIFSMRISRWSLFVICTGPLPKPALVSFDKISFWHGYDPNTKIVQTNWQHR